MVYRMMKPIDRSTLKTDEDVFNAVVAFLNEQGKPSVNPTNGNCAYRGEHGTMCAVGSLIQDGEYDESYEDLTVRQIFAEANDISWFSDGSKMYRAYRFAKETDANAFFIKHMNVLVMLQSAHDTASRTYVRDCRDFVTAFNGLIEDSKCVFKDGKLVYYATNQSY